MTKKWKWKNDKENRLSVTRSLDSPSNKGSYWVLCHLSQPCPHALRPHVGKGPNTLHSNRLNVDTVSGSLLSQGVERKANDPQLYSYLSFSSVLLSSLVQISTCWVVISQSGFLKPKRWTFLPMQFLLVNSLTHSLVPLFFPIFQVTSPIHVIE